MISQLEKNIHKLKRFPHEKKLKRLEQLEVISLAFGLERVIINKETVELQIVFKCYSYYPLPELCFVSIKSC